jgi:tetratricopeptide (TPR) repeat protein
MLDNVKYFICLKSVDKNISENHYDIALEKLNYLIKEEFQPSTTYLKRGILCKKLLMYDDAYSDFTYIITHCVQKKEAYYERLLLNFEIANYYEAILDSNMILSWEPDNLEVKRIKFLSLAYSMQDSVAAEYIYDNFCKDKFKTLQFLFQEVAILLAQDEYAKGLKILEIIDFIDKDNPIKLLKEANIYSLAGEKQKSDELMIKIESIFPKYFVSHFRFVDMYTQKDLLEISFLLELELFDRQGIFAYPMKILEGYKNHLEGHIIEAKEKFEQAIEINSLKPEAYVLLAQTLQLMSGYDNPELRVLAEENYKKAMEIYSRENLPDKVEEMRRQITHLKSGANVFCL